MPKNLLIPNSRLLLDLAWRPTLMHRLLAKERNKGLQRNNRYFFIIIWERSKRDICWVLSSLVYIKQSVCCLHVQATMETSPIVVCVLTPLTDQCKQIRRRPSTCSTLPTCEAANGKNYHSSTINSPSVFPSVHFQCFVCYFKNISKITAFPIQ